MPRGAIARFYVIAVLEGIPFEWELKWVKGISVLNYEQLMIELFAVAVFVELEDNVFQILACLMKTGGVFKH